MAKKAARKTKKLPKTPHPRGKNLRSQLWFDNPENPGMTALYLERYMNFGLTPKELRSGKPIVATRLLTHTQVLSDDTAFLTGVTPQEFARGIVAALTDREHAATVGRQAQLLADTKYSYEAYLARTRQACAHLFGDRAPQMADGVA